MIAATTVILTTCCVSLGSLALFGMGAMVDGFTWMKLTDGERSLYVSGYLGGLRDGSSTACQSAAQLMPGEDLQIKCLQTMPKYSKPSDRYVKQLTRYYETFPDDKKAPAVKLLVALSDQEHKTLEEIFLERKRRKPHLPED